MMNRTNVILLVMSSFILFSCNFTKPTDFILPNKKEGRYAIVYDCENGVSEKYEGGRLQHVFPENNILVVSYPQTSGITNYRFYYYEDGEKKEFYMPNQKEADSSFLALGPTRIHNSVFFKDIFYFGERPEDDNNELFFDFTRKVDEFIERQGLNCGEPLK